MSHRWSTIPAYPVMLAIALVLVAQTDTGISLAAAVRALVVLAILTVVLMAIFRVVTRDTAIAAAATAALILLARSVDPGPAATAGILGVLSTAAVIWSARKGSGGWRHRGTAVLNTIGGALLLVAAIGSLRGELGIIFPTVAAAEPVTTTSTAELPDIYVLLLDGYPRADTIGRILGTTNDRFAEALASRGFDIAVDARANYMYTAPSLISFFDLGEMGARARTVDAGPGRSLRPGDLINRGPALETLRKAGYRSYANLARWERESLRSADVFCDGGAINELELHLVRSSWVGRVLDLAFPDWKAARDRALIEDQLDCVQRAAELRDPDSPNFIFSHIGVPHLPIVFDEHGGPAPLDVYLDPLEVSDATRDRVLSAYRAQLAFVNGEALRTVDLLLRAPPRSAVMVLMSDHGSWLRIGADYDAKSDLRERFGILFAAITPGHEGLFHEDVTIGQVMPILLNTYLGTDVAVPESRYFFSRYDSIFTTTEIRDPFAP